MLGYFVRHPQAADDLEGIARWRLTEEIVRAKVEETRWALAWLVEHEYLLRTPTVGSGAVFSLNPAKVDEATALLAGGTVAAREDKA